MRYLGIDFGLKHFGLALADGPLAQPLVEKNYQDQIEILAYLNRLCHDQRIDTIILGLPGGQLEQSVLAFAKKLKTFIQLPVIFQDETLSTQEAKAKLLEAQAPQKKRRTNHSAAAALILQAYLDDQSAS